LQLNLQKVFQILKRGQKMNITISSLIRGALPLSALLLTACGGGGGGSSTTTPATTGANSVVYAVNKSAPVATCPTGGITVQSGIDTNGNGVLDPSEVTSTQYVCNGAAGPGITWVDAASSVQAVSNTGYMADNAAQVTITLPAAPNVGDVIQVNGIGAGGWSIAQNAGQSIITQDIVNIAGATTTGTITGAQYDAIELQYIAPNTFSVLNFAGNLVISTLSPGYVSEGGLTWMPVPMTLYDYYGAEALCLGSAHNGQTGWRLPTHTELNALYTAYPSNSATLRGLGWWVGLTWSSTMGNPGLHYYQSLSGGGGGTMPDVGTIGVTCVR
jgi:hypothetical protein